MTVQWGVDTLCRYCGGAKVNRHGFDCLHCSGSGLEPSQKAVARRSDPETSQAAAATVNITSGQQYVLDALRRLGPSTDEALVDYLNRLGLPISESGARTRRSELVRDGFVVAAGTTKLSSGRRGTRWAAR